MKFHEKRAIRKSSKLREFRERKYRVLREILKKKKISKGNSEEKKMEAKRTKQRLRGSRRG